MTIRIDGLGELQKALKRLSDNAAALGGKHQVPMTELFHRDFMQTHTSFQDFESFVTESGLVQGDLTPESFAAIPDAAWDEWVQKETTFSNWQEMLTRASTEWAQNRMFEGVGHRG